MCYLEGTVLIGVGLPIVAVKREITVFARINEDTGNARQMG